jgi:hypothetical protein
MAPTARTQRAGQFLSQLPSPFPMLGDSFVQARRLRVVVADLGVCSPQLNDGAWGTARGVLRGLRSALAQHTDAAAAGLTAPDALLVGAYGECRLPYTAADTPRASATVHLGVDVFCPAGQQVCAPCACTVVCSSPGGSVVTLALADDSLRAVLELRVAGVRLLEGVREGAVLERGSAFAAVAPAPPSSLLPPHLHLQAAAPGLRPPGLCAPSIAAAWLAVCPNPARLLGLATEQCVAARRPGDGPELDASTMLAVRKQGVSRAQAHYFSSPPIMQRGWRQHMIDDKGRSYLDMVNNVTVLGHSDPVFSEKLSRQLRLINTNSRFL